MGFIFGVTSIFRLPMIRFIGSNNFSRTPKKQTVLRLQLRYIPMIFQVIELWKVIWPSNSPCIFSTTAEKCSYIYWNIFRGGIMASKIKFKNWRNRKYNLWYTLFVTDFGCLLVDRIIWKVCTRFSQILYAIIRINKCRNEIFPLWSFFRKYRKHLGMLWPNAMNNMNERACLWEIMGKTKKIFQNVIMRLDLEINNKNVNKW